MTSVPATQPTESIAEKFARLAATWREAAPLHPRQPVRYNHPAYQEIITLGPAVVPFLLRDLAEKHRHWFWALHIITGADPVLPAEREDPFSMTDAWLRWGRAHDYLVKEESRAMDTSGEEGETHQPPSSPPAAARESLVERFRLLTAVWEAETAVQSSVTTITFHPAFQEIVAM